MRLGFCVTQLVPIPPDPKRSPTLAEWSVLAAIAVYLTYQMWGFFSTSNTTYRNADRELMTSLVQDLREANKQSRADSQQMIHELRSLRDEMRQMREGK